MVGGKPRSAHYFAGVTASGRLLYLDPHSVQPALSGARTLRSRRVRC